MFAVDTRVSKFNLSDIGSSNLNSGEFSFHMHQPDKYMLAVSSLVARSICHSL